MTFWNMKTDFWEMKLNKMGQDLEMNKITMKKTVIILNIVALIASGCGQTQSRNEKAHHKQVSSMENVTEKSKIIPENTLSVIQADGKTIYLTIIGKVPTEVLDILPNSLYAKAKVMNILYFVFIEGDYPNDYAEKAYYMNVFPEGKMVGLSLWLEYNVNFKSKIKTMIYSTDYKTGEWENVGYSTDNSLWAKIYAYYLEIEIKK